MHHFYDLSSVLLLFQFKNFLWQVNECLELILHCFLPVGILTFCSARPTVVTESPGVSVSASTLYWHELKSPDPFGSAGP